MTYTKRTCNECGRRDIQPNMFQKEITYNSGSSKRNVGVTTFLGAALGDKKSTRSIADSIFNTQGRTYTRRRKVWLCRECSGVAAEERRAAAKYEKKAELEAINAVRKKKRAIEVQQRAQEKSQLKMLQKEKYNKVVTFLRSRTLSEISKSVEKVCDKGCFGKNDLNRVKKFKADATRNVFQKIANSTIYSFFWAVIITIIMLGISVSNAVSSERVGEAFATFILLGIPILFVYRMRRLSKQRSYAVEYFWPVVNEL
ncbi:hypothetical protein [Sulfitobacter sp.]|uniref:hypothetical protein n=1 Tax=Sulfitobacter sp. TaxID=1903071 RepID=UPI003F6D32E5